MGENKILIKEAVAQFTGFYECYNGATINKIDMKTKEKILEEELLNLIKIANGTKAGQITHKLAEIEEIIKKEKDFYAQEKLREWLPEEMHSHLDPAFFKKEQEDLKTDREQVIFGRGCNYCRQQTLNNSKK